MSPKPQISKLFKLNWSISSQQAIRKLVLRKRKCSKVNTKNLKRNYTSNWSVALSSNYNRPSNLIPSNSDYTTRTRVFIRCIRCSSFSNRKPTPSPPSVQFSSSSNQCSSSTSSPTLQNISSDSSNRNSPTMLSNSSAANSTSNVHQASANPACAKEEWPLLRTYSPTNSSECYVKRYYAFGRSWTCSCII